MATIYRCDRCNYEADSRYKLFPISIPRFSMHEDNERYSKDLCESCWSQIINLVNNKK